MASSHLCRCTTFMNPQPYQTPPQWWPSRLSPRFVRWARPFLRNSLRNQGITRLEVRDADAVQESLNAGAGVLIACNHAFHFDSRVFVEAGAQAGWCAHFMSAWQVFGMVPAWQRWILQRYGCFSINREGTDTKAFRQAVQILTSERWPLVIFPEGDIYHSNDLVMPFQEGVGAIALSARKRTERPIHVIPCAMKCFYTSDPTSELQNTMCQLESYVRWRPRPDLSLLDRIYRFGEGFLALKEVEYLGHPQSGPLPERIRGLANSILHETRDRHEIPHRGQTISEQIRNVRGQLIRLIERAPSTTGAPTDDAWLEQLHKSLHDMFFVTQLSSYRGNYTAADPSIERIAETIDKFEEDIFELDTPTPRGKRKAVVRFGEAFAVSNQSNSAELTTTIERHVQCLLDEINGSG